MAMPDLLAEGRERGLALVTLTTLVQGAAAAAAAFATRGLFDALHAAAPLGGTQLAVLAASGIVIAGARVLARVLGERLGQAYALALRLALLEHAAAMPASAVSARRSGYMSLRFVGDMTAFRNWLAKGLPRLIAGAVMVPTACAVLWVLEPRFALVCGPLLLGLLGVMAVVGPRLEPLHRRLRARRARIAAEMAERMPLAPELDRMGRRPAELRSLRKRTGDMIRAGVQRLCWAESLKALPDAVAGLAACAVIVTGAQAGVGSGTIAGALAALGLAAAPLRDLASVWNFRAAYLAAHRKCAAALARGGRGVGNGGTRLPAGAVHLRLRAGALAGIGAPLDVPAGARHDLTCDLRSADALFAALCGLEPMAQGAVRLSGVCLTQVSRGSLRRGVLRLDSAPLLLHGTLRRNLALGLSERPSDARLLRAATKAGLGAWLVRSGGLDGTTAEAGRDLAAQERSAVSLARMLLGRPKLALLGDALLHLDPKAQQALAVHLGRCGTTVLRHPVLAASLRAVAATNGAPLP